MTPTSASIDWRSVAMPGIDSSTVAIVLGAGGAIGGATARALAAMGATVAVATRDLDRSTAVAAAITDEFKPSRPALPVVADLAVPGSLTAMAAEVSDRLGAPTVLVNSAAIGYAHADITEVPRADVSKMFDVNVVGAFDAAAAVAPAMRAAGYGRIVNVASIAALRAVPGGVVYAATKGGLITLTKMIAVELGGDGITVNSVSPGQTPTKLRDIHEEAGLPQEETGGSTRAVPVGRRGLLDDYVGAIIFLSSGLAGYITGMDIQVEGGARLVRAKTF